MMLIIPLVIAGAGDVLGDVAADGAADAVADASSAKVPDVPETPTGGTQEPNKQD